MGQIDFSSLLGAHLEKEETNKNTIPASLKYDIDKLVYRHYNGDSYGAKKYKASKLAVSMYDNSPFVSNPICVGLRLFKSSVSICNILLAADVAI